MRNFNTLAFLAAIFGGCTFLIGQLTQEEHLLPASPNWLDGSVMQAFDQRVSRNAPRSKHVDNAINGLLFAVTGDPDPQVRQGCSGWLFLTEELVETPQGHIHLEQRIRLAHLLLTDLAKRGIHVVAVPVPDKAEQAQAQLCGLQVSQQAQGRRAAWNAASLSMPLPQVDLHTGWVSPGYWRTDSHWNRIGAQWAAARVAEKMQPFIASAALSMDIQQTGSPHVRIGDLTRLASIDNNMPPFAPAPDMDTPENLTIAHSGGLLDDAPAPAILLAGSSYSVNADFIAYLQQQTGQEIAQQSRVGSGFAGSLLDLLIDHPQQLNGIKLLVWEWPLRSLYQPLSTKELQYLQTQEAHP